MMDLILDLLEIYVLFVVLTMSSKYKTEDVCIDKNTLHIVKIEEVCFGLSGYYYWVTPLQGKTYKLKQTNLILHK